MTTVFAIKNQHGLFLTKQQEWVSGADNHSLYRTAHKDEAINTVFELSSRDIYVRAEIAACATDEKGNPLIEVSAAEPSPEFDADAGLDADVDADDTSDESQTA